MNYSALEQELSNFEGQRVHYEWHMHTLFTALGYPLNKFDDLTPEASIDKKVAPQALVDRHSEEAMGGRKKEVIYFIESDIVNALAYLDREHKIDLGKYGIRFNSGQMVNSQDGPINVGLLLVHVLIHMQRPFPGSLNGLK